jgi:hypothetical protein
MHDTKDVKGYVQEKSQRVFMNEAVLPELPTDAALSLREEMLDARVSRRCYMMTAICIC